MRTQSTKSKRSRQSHLSASSEKYKRQQSDRKTRLEQRNQVRKQLLKNHKEMLIRKYKAALQAQLQHDYKISPLEPPQSIDEKQEVSSPLSEASPQLFFVENPKPVNFQRYDIGIENVMYSKDNDFEFEPFPLSY